MLASSLFGISNPNFELHYRSAPFFAPQCIKLPLVYERDFDIEPDFVFREHVHNIATHLLDSLSKGTLAQARASSPSKTHEENFAIDYPLYALAHFYVSLQTGEQIKQAKHNETTRTYKRLILGKTRESESFRKFIVHLEESIQYLLTRLDNEGEDKKEALSPVLDEYRKECLAAFYRSLTNDRNEPKVRKNTLRAALKNAQKSVLDNPAISQRRQLYQHCNRFIQTIVWLFSWIRTQSEQLFDEVHTETLRHSQDCFTPSSLRA